MKTAEFLSVYPREMSPGEIHHGAQIPEVRAAQRYSYGYGLVAHAALRGEHEQIPSLLPSLVAYEQNTNFHEVEQKLIEEGSWEYRNEINFHMLNTHMKDLWTPLVEGGWPKETDRSRTIHVAMNSLAVEGLIYYTARERHAKKFGTEVLYDMGSDLEADLEAKIFHERLTGVLQEIDVAIVILDIIRKYPHVTVVPAPLQFERTRSNTNADLLVVDTENDRMLGVQTKTSVSQATADRYDPSRIAIVDGSVDLGNVRVVRTQRGRSTTQPKPWAGIVAASRVHAIQLHGKHQQIPTRYAPGIVRLKMMAREAVGKLRVDHRDLSKKINDRIINKLYAE